VDPAAKKILLVANTDWYLYNFRLSFARFLRQKGWQVVLVSPPGDFAAAIQEEGFRWLAWHLDRRSMNPFYEAAALFQLWRIYCQEKPDLVHHLTIKPVLYGSLAALVSKVPAIVNAITGLGYLFLNDNWLTRQVRTLVKWVYRWLMNRPNTVVIFENEANRCQFIREGIVRPERTYLIEGVGVDVERFSPQPEPQGMPVVLFPARLLREKGIYTLVEAARMLKEQGEPMRFWLAGDVDEGNPGSVRADEVRSWVEEGLVEWLGWRADMPSVYAQSNLVVLPSWGEGIPTVLLEAGACGRAVVATDVPGCRDVIEEGFNGRLVAVDDVKGLAEAIEWMISNPAERQRMGQNARRRVVERFSDRVIHRQTWNVYWKVLKERDK